jgi:VID27 N-terminal region
MSDVKNKLSQQLRSPPIIFFRLCKESKVCNMPRHRQHQHSSTSRLYIPTTAPRKRIERLRGPCLFSRDWDALYGENLTKPKSPRSLLVNSTLSDQKTPLKEQVSACIYPSALWTLINGRFKDAAASIRRTTTEYNYQLVIQRAYEEGEEQLYESDDNLEDRIYSSPLAVVVII